VSRSIRFQIFAGTVALLAMNAGVYLSVVPTGEGFGLFCLLNAALFFTAAAVLRMMVSLSSNSRACDLELFLPADVSRELYMDNNLFGLHRQAMIESPESLVKLLGEHIQQQNELLRAGFNDSFGSLATATTSQISNPSTENETQETLFGGVKSVSYPDEETLARLRSELAALQDQFNTDLNQFRKR